MVVVAQLVRALDCGSRGRRFEPGLPPSKAFAQMRKGFFCTRPRSSLQRKAYKKDPNGEAVEALLAGSPLPDHSHLLRKWL